MLPSAYRRLQGCRREILFRAGHALLCGCTNLGVMGWLDPAIPSEIEVDFARPQAGVAFAWVAGSSPAMTI